MSQYLQSLFLKVLKSVGAPRDHFHLIVENLSDAVTFAEPPHDNHGLQPVQQRLRQTAQVVICMAFFFNLQDILLTPIFFSSDSREAHIASLRLIDCCES